MKQPLISVIVPVYNTEKYIEKCLKSILDQNYTNFEVIIIDDGSTDQSLKICKQYQDKDKHIKIFAQKNQGSSSARNLGLTKATGEYICFVDSDDEIKPDFIKTLVDGSDEKIFFGVSICRRMLRQKNYINLYAKQLRTKKSGESFKEYILWLLLQDGRLYPVVNKIFRGDIIQKYNLRFDESLKFAEDLDFVLNYLQHIDGEVNFSTKPLYIYNYGTNTSMMSKTSKDWRNWQISYSKLQKWVGKDATLKSKKLLFLVKMRWRISCFKNHFR